MFPCLCSCAIHIEVAQSLETDSFILSLKRFIGRQGNIHLMRSDNGTNFVVAINELRKAFQEMDHNQISQYLQRHGADWITGSEIHLQQVPWVEYGNDRLEQQQASV